MIVSLFNKWTLSMSSSILISSSFLEDGGRWIVENVFSLRNRRPRHPLERGRALKLRLFESRVGCFFHLHHSIHLLSWGFFFILYFKQMMLPVRHQRARQCLTPQQTVQLWKHAPPRIKAQRNSLSSAGASPLKREQCGHWAGILEPWLKPDYRSCRVWGGNVISSLIRSAVVLHPVPSVGPCD